MKFDLPSAAVAIERPRVLLKQKEPRPCAAFSVGVAPPDLLSIRLLLLIVVVVGSLPGYLLLSFGLVRSNKSS